MLVDHVSFRPDRYASAPTKGAAYAAWTARRLAAGNSMNVLQPALIAAILWIATMAALAAGPAPQTEVHPDVAPPVSPLAAQQLDRLSATRDRPLFSPTRRPPAPPPIVAAAPPPPPSPPDVALLGVVMDGKEARAVVRAGSAAKILRVRIGDDIGDWKVGQIEARQLVLLLDGRAATFTMFARKNTKGSSNAGTAERSSSGIYQNLAQQHHTATDEPVPASRKRTH